MRGSTIFCIVVLLVGVLALPLCAEEKAARYEFDPSGELIVNTTGPAEGEAIEYVCPMLPGKHVIIPEGAQWGVTIEGADRATLSSLKEHLVARRVNRLTLGYPLDNNDISVLSEIPWVEEINLSKIYVRPEIVEGLRSVSSLKRLFFDECSFADEAVRAIAALQPAEGISLRADSLTPDQLAMLKGCGSIVCFSSYGLPEHWQGMRILATMPNLTNLFLIGTFTDDDVLLLKSLTKMKDLMLSSKAKTSAIPEILRSMGSIEKLNVNCASSAEGLFLACRELPDLKSLVLSGIDFDSKAVEAFKSLGRITSLYVYRCKGITPDALCDRATLANLNAEESLVATISPVKAAEMKSLEVLTVQGELTAASARVVAAFPSLKRLELVWGASKEGAEVLAESLGNLLWLRTFGPTNGFLKTCGPGLKSLMIDQPVTEFFTQDMKLLSAVEQLSVWGGERLRKSDYALLGSLQTLRGLHILAMPADLLTDAFLDALRDAPNLERLGLLGAYDLTSEGIARLATLEKLTSFRPTQRELRKNQRKRVHEVLGDLVSSVKGQFLKGGNNAPGSEAFPPEKWQCWPLQGDSMYGYRFIYISNASKPNLSDGSRFAFLVIPADISVGSYAYLRDGSAKHSCRSAILSAEAIESLFAAGAADVLIELPPEGGEYVIKGIPFHYVDSFDEGEDPLGPPLPPKPK